MRNAWVVICLAGLFGAVLSGCFVTPDMAAYSAQQVYAEAQVSSQDGSYEESSAQVQVYQEPAQVHVYQTTPAVVVTQPVVVNQPVVVSQPVVVPSPTLHRHVGCGMPPSDFAALRNAVADASFESDRMRVVQAAASSNSFLVSQVIGILNEMTFDDEKVSAAAALYPSVCDPNNWFQVYNVLTFSSSKEKLELMTGR